MAQRVEVLLIDDVDGTEATETITFAVDGRSYEIDLSASHAAQLRADLDRWVTSGRRTRVKTGPEPTRIDLGPSTQVLRKWAAANGHTVSAQGRVPAAVRDAYLRAHPATS